MISPDVAAAVPRLEQQKVLSPQQADLFGRIARGELVSLSGAIHTLLYLGVAGITAGVGLLFKDQNPGPLITALAIGLVAALCIAWAARRSAPYSRLAVESPSLAFDYVLVLGALLAAADLAYVETQLRPLGDQWAYHLLFVSLAYLALAFRFDSRTLFGLALTTFAAWRGVAAMSIERSLFWFGREDSAVRANAFVCGVLFVAVGVLLRRRDVKVHFEPTAAHLGWLLILQAMGWNVFDGKSASGARLLLMMVGGALAWFSWRQGRFSLFVMGALAAYLAFIISLGVALDGFLLLILLGGSAVGFILGLLQAHHRFPKEKVE